MQGRLGLNGDYGGRNVCVFHLRCYLSFFLFNEDGDMGLLFMLIVYFG